MSFQTYSWDDRGNLIHDGVYTYTYNTAGRMVQAQNLTATLVYTYNADGLRVAQSQSVASVQSVDTFTWDWATGIPELLSDGDALYLIGYDTLGWQTGTDWTFVLPDALGSVRQETDAAGAVTAVREWSPYGEEIGGARNGLGFTSEWYDANVGLTYLRARWLDVGMGRFTRRDPVATSTFYRYASNNPINRVDPTGYIDWPTCALQGDYGTCTIWDGDTYYKIGREIIAAGIPIGLGEIVADITALNPQNPNPDYIRIGEPLTLRAGWIQAVLNSQYTPLPVIPPPPPTPSPSPLPSIPLPPFLPPPTPKRYCQPPPCPFCPTGYLEGVVDSGTLLAATPKLEGTEVVYDFVNLRRAWFRFAGEGFSTNIIDVSRAMYAGLVWGFDKDYGSGSAGVNQQYAGRSVGLSAGATVIIPPIFPVYVGGGGGVFSSSPDAWPGQPNWNVWGIVQYYSAGGGTGFADNPFGAAGYTVVYEPPLEYEQYTDFHQMAVNIRSGDRSPISGLFNPALFQQRNAGIALGWLWSILE